MEAVQMRNINLSCDEIRALNRERFYHPHPEVRRRMTVVWMWSQGRKQLDCAQIAGISERTVRRYIEGFETNGLDWLREIRWKGHPSRLHPHANTLEAEFQKNPPWTVAEAGDRIKKLCGIHVQPTQVRAFLHSQNFKWRKIAAIPVPPKKTIEEHVAAQREFLDTKLEPVLSAARAGQGHVFFVDAAHFVLGMYLCSLWSQSRLFIRSSSGRQRFNVLGAWNAVTHQFVAVCNTTVVNQETFCELLLKISVLALPGPVTLVLDNARYQHCARCIARADELGITLLFLTSYSPNLNLIERLWKFIKNDCLYGRHFPSFANFRSRIEDCINAFDSTHKCKLNLLMTHNFQTFENQSILAA
jgi:transposase